MERQGCELLQLYFSLQIQLFIINFYACLSVLKDIQWCGSYWNHYKNNKLEKKASFWRFHLLYRTSNRKYCKIVKLHSYNPQALNKKSPVLQQVSIISTVDYRTITSAPMCWSSREADWGAGIVYTGSCVSSLGYLLSVFLY